MRLAPRHGSSRSGGLVNASLQSAKTASASSSRGARISMSMAPMLSGSMCGQPSRRYEARSEVPRSPVATTSYFPAASPSVR